MQLLMTNAWKNCTRVHGKVLEAIHSIGDLSKEPTHGHQVLKWHLQSHKEASYAIQSQDHI